MQLEFLSYIFTLFNLPTDSAIGYLLIEPAIIIFLTILGLVAVNKFLKRMENIFAKNKFIIDDAFAYALRRPTIAFVFLVGCYYFLTHFLKIIFLQQIIVFKVNYQSTVASFIFLLYLLWTAYGLIHYYEINFKPGKTDRSFYFSILRMFKFLLFIVGLIILLQNMGVNVTSLLALGGIGGIAIGFASKDFLSNFLGGVLIYLDNPFKTGDWIRSSEKEIEGVVEEISWRRCVICTFEKRLLYIPNSLFLSIVIENCTRMRNRRIQEHIGIRYQDVKVINPILEEVRSYIKKSDLIDQKQSVVINFDAFNDSSLTLLLYCFTKTTDWAIYHSNKEQILLHIYEIIRKHNADIAFPTKSIIIENSTSANT